MAPIKTEKPDFGLGLPVPHVKTENLGLGQSAVAPPPPSSSSSMPRSISDIDSPVKPTNESNSWSSLFGDDLSIPASNLAQSSFVEVKQEKDSFSSKAAAKSHSEVFAPKASKMSSLFSPQSDTESKPVIRTSSLPPPSASNFAASDVKPVIKEELSLLHASGDFGRSTAAAPEPKVEPQLLCSIPNVEDVDKAHKKEKKHKEKKKKKNKDKDKDRESEEKDKGEEGSGSSKRHKNKHKEKSKHRDEERPVAEVAPKPTLKLKISLPPPTSAPPPAPAASVAPSQSIAPLKIRLSSDAGDSGSKKRPRDSLENGPAPKRVSVDHGGSNSSLNHHHHHHQHKSSKKVRRFTHVAFSFV